MLNRFLDIIKKDNQKVIYIGMVFNLLKVWYTDLGQDSCYYIEHLPTETLYVARSYDLHATIAFARSIHNTAELYQLGDL